MQHIVTADIDECDTSTHQCTQECKNTKGSYQCFCTHGYSLNDDGFTCDGNNIIIIVSK